MATRRRSTTVHPTPSLLAALALFADVGMKPDDLVNFCDGWAEFVKDGVRYRKAVVDAALNCKVEGDTLLSALAALTEQVQFTIEDAQLHVHSAGHAYKMAAQPADEIRPATFMQPTTIDAVGLFVSLAEVAKKHSAKLQLEGGKLSLNAARTLVMQADVGVHCPARLLETADVLKLKKPMIKKLTPSGFGYYGADDLALFFGTSDRDPDAACIIFGTAAEEPFNDRIMALWPEALTVRPSAAFFAVLKQFDKMADEPIVRMTEGKHGRHTAELVGNAKLSAERDIDCAGIGTYRIGSLLAIEQFADACEFNDAPGVDAFWFQRGKVRGVLASVAVGSIDDVSALIPADEIEVDASAFVG